MVIEKISLSQIVETQPLPQRKKIEAIKETIKRDEGIELLNPLYCKDLNDFYFILDGNHRYISAKELGYEEMWIEY